jgi:putative oxidoreductase
VVGWKARWAALGIAIFLVIITPLFHNFWSAAAEARPAHQFPEERVDPRRDVARVRVRAGAGRYSIDKGGDAVALHSSVSMR